MATLAEIIEDCRLPLPGLPTIPELEIPGIDISIELLLDVINVAIDQVLECVNDCFNVNLSIEEIIKISIPDLDILDFSINKDAYILRWLQTPGLGAWISSLVDILVYPIKTQLEFICSIFSFFSCLLSKTPEQIALDLADSLSGNASEDNCFGNIFIWPWPFPWDWIPDFSINIPCLDELSIPEFKLELKETGIDVGCILGLNNFSDVLLTIINGITNTLPGLCSKEKIDGFFDVSDSVVIQVIGLGVYLLFGLLDKVTSFASCFFENLIGDSLNFDLDTDFVLRLILEFFELVIPGFEIGLDIEEAFDRLKLTVPWICVIECVIKKVMGVSIEPFIEILNQILTLATSPITAILSPLGALGISPADILEALGLPLIEDTLCIDLATLFGVQECSI